jgi:hypothetical protein
MVGQPLSSLTDAENQCTSLINTLDNTNDLTLDNDALSLAQCLGINFNNVTGGFLGSNIPYLNLASIFKNYLDSLVNGFLSLLDTLLSPFEKAIGQAISALMNLIPTSLLDQILNLVQCLSGCPGASGLPTIVDIETQLTTVGLNINSEIDFSSDIITESVGIIPTTNQIQYNNIGNMITSVNNKAKDLLKNSPF